MADSGREFERLLSLVARLRAEDGCPWDREQTPGTIKRYLLEEVYEVMDAVEHLPPHHVAEELGDLIFMLIFLAHLYAEQGHFQMDEVLSKVAEKMVRRHPHVFGDLKVDSARQVKLNWEEIKRQERPNRGLGAALNEIPLALPALMRAYRILSRLVRRLHRPFRQDILKSQLQETFATLLELGLSEDGPPRAAVLGKVLLLLVAYDFPADTRPEEALASTLQRFCRQVDRLEASLTEQGKDWQDLSEIQERSLWEKL